MSTGQAVALVALLIAVVAAPAAALSGPGGPDTSAAVGSPAGAELGPAGPSQPRVGVGSGDAPATPSALESQPNTTFRVRIQPDGDARWRITTTFNLSTDAEVDSFEALAAAFEDGETSQLGLEAFQRAATAASRETGRQMVLTDERRTSSVPSDLPGRATLVLEFTWTNFGRTSDDTVAVGDVFNTSDQWFEGLEANQQLRVQWPEGWTLVQSPPVGVHNRSLVWNGPRSFARDDISATFAGDRGDGVGGGTTQTTTTDGGEPRAEFPWLPVAGVAILAVVILGLLVLRRSDATIAGTAAEESATDGSGTAAGESDSGAPAGGPGGDVSPEAAAEEVDEDLLSDEERVERLLEQNGGRMKQANIVKETGWSNAKVSQLLSSMDEDDRIDKLRIGRENLISFPDEDVTDPDE